MKLLALLLVLSGMLSLLTACGTPGYSAQERNQQIARNWEYDWHQASDDFDHLLLLRPASHLTIWNVQ